MKRQLAFVLGGGGARGALQVGALQALLEAGYCPDILIGTSIGAVNATFLALKGINCEGIDELKQSWYDAAAAHLLPSSYLWLTFRTLFRRPSTASINRLEEFFNTHGLRPDIQFGDIQGARLGIVAGDLNNGELVLYGRDPEEEVLEGLLASTALPPWIPLVEKNGKLLIDGGAVSNLPIASALDLGATEIIALNLSDIRSRTFTPTGLSPYIAKLFNIIEQRQIDLELALASNQGVPVRMINLQGSYPVPVWNFDHTDELIAQGYEIAQAVIPDWKKAREPRWRTWLDQVKQWDYVQRWVSS